MLVKGGRWLHCHCLLRLRSSPRATPFDSRLSPPLRPSSLARFFLPSSRRSQLRGKVISPPRRPWDLLTTVPGLALSVFLDGVLNSEIALPKPLVKELFS